MNFTKTILDWYDAHGRKLPWRERRNPYAIWLCEIIMQQTRIAQGLGYWERFMARFPRVEDLAEATEDEVLKLWAGLGYYSRARNLHTAAKQIAALGKFPDRLEDIRALKGVGDYTAAAIGSIAFGLPAAVVDGNVYRVLARYFGIETPIGSNAAKKEFTQLAQSLLPSERPGDFNEAMMDFGAIQCTPQSPRCIDCPLATQCVARIENKTALLPVKSGKTAIQHRYFSYIYLRCGKEVALRKRPAGDIWAGLWEPIFLEGPAEQNGLERPAAQNGLELKLVQKDVRHQLSHRTLHVDFYCCECKEKPSLPEGYLWINEDDLEQYGKPRLVERLIQSLTP